MYGSYRTAFIGDLIIIAAVTSLVAKIGCYIKYGKVGGAKALPERKHVRERKAREAQRERERRAEQDGPALA